MKNLSKFIIAGLVGLALASNVMADRKGRTAWTPAERIEHGQRSVKNWTRTVVAAKKSNDAEYLKWAEGNLKRSETRLEHYKGLKARMPAMRAKALAIKKGAERKPVTRTARPITKRPADRPTARAGSRTATAAKTAPRTLAKQTTSRGSLAKREVYKRAHARDLEAKKLAAEAKTKSTEPTWTERIFGKKA